MREREQRNNRPGIYKDGVMPGEFDQSTWEGSILTGASDLTYMQIQGGREMRRLSLTSETWEQKTLLDIYDIERRFQHGGNITSPPRYNNLKNRILKDTADNIRRKQRYYVLPRLAQAVNELPLPQREKGVLSTNVIAIYLLLCSPTKFLVGLEDGVHWKEIDWGKEKIERVESFRRTWNIATEYFSLLPFIGERQLPLVPDNPIRFRNMDQVRIPKPARKVDELLEDAFYNQRYLVPPEGADVRFRNAGSIERMILMPGPDNIAARITTAQGEETIVLDLNTAEAEAIRRDQDNDAFELLAVRFGHVLAEVYHDIVTAIELPVNRFKPLGDPHVITDYFGKELEDEEQPQVIYIPRIVRIGEEPGVRLPYIDSGKSRVPHRVSGHRRKVNMTEKQRQRLLDFEREHGVSILANLPTGYTFIRPFISPTNAEATFRDLPLFIKKRVETKLQDQLKK